MEQIRNIYCVGRNYGLHAQELGNDVPTSPFLFSKPTHAFVEANGQEILLPGNQGELHHEAELVFRMARPFESGATLDDLIDGMAIGIDFTLRDVQNGLKKKGHPWLLAKGFRNSAVVTPFRPFPGMKACLQTDFLLLKNGDQVQQGNLSDVIFDLDTILRFTAVHFGLSKGDLIFTGTPAGVGPVVDRDRLVMMWGEEAWGDFTVRLDQ